MGAAAVAILTAKSKRSKNSWFTLALHLQENDTKLTHKKYPEL